MSKNYASAFSPKVDERFSQKSIVNGLIGNNNYKFDGVDTVEVYSYPVVPEGTYDPNAADVYGTCHAVEPRLQKMTIGQQKTFNYKIARLDRLNTQMTANANRQMTRQIDQVITPRYDHHVLSTISNAAKEYGNFDNEAITKENAYSQFLKAQEYMGDVMAPEAGKIFVCSYPYYNLLKLDPAFVPGGDLSQKLRLKGVVGTVDGVPIRPVPSARLQAGVSGIMTHPYATCSPIKLRDYIIHDNPPGWNGWKCEGLFVYDAFVLNEQAAGIYVIGGGKATRKIQICTSPDPGSSNKTILTVMSPKDADDHKWFYKSGNQASNVAYEQEIGAGDGWTELTVNGSAVDAGANGAMVTVVETNAEGKALAVGVTKVSIA